MSYAHHDKRLEPQPGDEVGRWMADVRVATRENRGRCLRMREPHAYWGFNTLTRAGWVICLQCGDMPTGPDQLHIVNRTPS